jgi:hypothetical protein
MAKLNVVFGAVTSPLKRGFNKVQSMIGGLSSLLMGGLAVGITAVGLGIKNMVAAGAKIEQTKVAFEVLLGSAEKAASTIKELRGFADVTPFDTDSVIEASRALIATGSAGNLLQKELQMAGDIAAGTGKRLQDIVNIYAKVKRQGRLTFEEINQLASSGALTMEELYQKTGKSKQAFRTFVEAGRADFSLIRDIFEQSTSEGGRFNDMMVKLSKTLGGKYSTLIGKTQTLLANLGEGTTGPLTTMVEKMIEGVDALSKWDAFFITISASAQGLADIMERTFGGKEKTGFDPVAGKFTYREGVLDKAADSYKQKEQSTFARMGGGDLGFWLRKLGFGQEFHAGVARGSDLRRGSGMFSGSTNADDLNLRRTNELLQKIAAQSDRQQTAGGR